VPAWVGGLFAVAVAGVFAGLGLDDVLGGWATPGIDYLPLRHAAESLLAGQSVFTDPAFVYPPTAAVLLLPTALGPATVGFVWWVLAGVAALLLAAWLIAREAPRHRLAVFGVAAMGLLGGVIADRSIFLGNLSELLVPVAVGILMAFRRGRWTLGCALLAGSLLVKPMLAPLVLVPLLSGAWLPLLTTMAPAGGLLLLSMGLAPGGEKFVSVFKYCLSGTNLHGDNAVNNLSLRGWAEGQGAPHLLGVAASVVVGVAVLVVIVRSPRAGSPIRLGAVLLFGTFLAGGISEVHFLLTGYAVVLLYLTVERAPVRWFMPGLLLLAAPQAYPDLLFGIGTDGQSWMVAAELMLLAALLGAPTGKTPEQAAALSPALVPVVA
jgi:hypothetical protein